MKIKNPLKRKKKQPKIEKIPAKWLSKEQREKLPQGTETVIVVHEKAAKIRIPGLRTLKRLIAFGLMVISGLFSIGSLATPQYASFITLYFLFSAFIMLDYLWRTRKKAQLEWEKEEEK